MNPIAIRLLSQQLICPQFSSPVEVVSHMGAMQAQDYRMVRWAVAMRMKKPSAEAFRQAFDSGEIIRIHLLRGTWQLVSCHDYRWLLQLYAKKAEKVIRGWMKANKVSIEDDELHGVREILTSVCETKGSVTKDDFANALKEHAIVMDSHRLSYHLRLAEIDGLLCSGNLSPMQATYALAAEKVGPADRIDRDDMLKLLTRKYFQSHSPATFEDFLWWSGLSASDCRKGMAMLESELRQETWCGYEFYLHESCRTIGFRSGKSLLLSPFDEYLIGYKSRELVISPAHMHHAYTNNGIFFPIIAHDGIICGNWAPWEKELRTSHFRSVENKLSIDGQWNLFCKLKAAAF